MELNHPTAQELYEHIHAKPDSFGKKISLGTVYRNLQILEENGKLISIDSSSFVTHYDARLDPHYHFICKNCGVVLDIAMDYMNELNDKAQKGNDCRIESHSLAFEGCCEKCKGLP
jgi:Fur family peroxide stress response transcriptional regulator